MGRGRAKAKQTKVARRLKYGGPQTDLERLQAELAGSSVDHFAVPDLDEVDDPEAFDDVYSRYIDEDDEPEDDQR